MANLCEISGCGACCCHDMVLPWKDNYPKPETFFPQVTDIYTLNPDSPTGVYQVKDGSKTNIVIRGNCPNLKNNSCEIYNNRPPVCKILRIFSPECMEARTRDGKAEINKEVYRYGRD